VHTLLYIEDLTAAYSSPCVMDVKMGTRTFQEKEADNPLRRLDLMAKMKKVDATALSAEDLEHGVTKLRYMQFREDASSSATQGWRIEGIHHGYTGKVEVKKTMRDAAPLKATLETFCQSEQRTAAQLERRLAALRDALQASEWFTSHELTGSSLLVIYDAATPPSAPPGAWMIDFAHCNKVDTPLTHRVPWVKGNHEEGYLFGLDKLVGMFGELAAELGGESAGAGSVSNGTAAKQLSGHL